MDEMPARVGQEERNRSEQQLRSFKALLGLFEGEEPIDVETLQSRFSQFLSDRQDYYIHDLNFYKAFLKKLDQEEEQDPEVAQSKDFGLFKMMINGFANTAKDHLYDFALFRILSMNVFSKTQSIDTMRQAISSFAPFIQQLREESQKAAIQEKQTKEAWNKLHAKPRTPVS